MKKKRFISILAALLLAIPLLGGCGSSTSGSGDKLYVYNAGEYIDPDVIDLFEEETGIDVIYDEFETLEVMYPKVAANPSQYDVICPSDYMVAKMMDNDLLSPLDFSKLPNATANIGEDYWTQASEFDPNNEYCVPYAWGTVGILYDTTRVDGEVTSWDILWDDTYADEILMQDSVRDLYAIPLKRMGYSLNTLDEKELQEATDMLIEQKPLVQAYVVDEVRDKMIGDEAIIGVIYSGEAEICIEANEKLSYAIPEEGTNLWIDGWVITSESKHKDAAHEWINFMCRADVALMNFEYIYYSTPNERVKEMVDEETAENEVLFPDLSKYQNLESFIYIGEEGDRLYFDYWKDVKSAY